MFVQRSDTVVTTKRLVLSPPHKRDFSDWADARNRSAEHLAPWEPSWPVEAHSRADWSHRLKAWRQGWKDGRAFVFLIRRLEDRQMVGGLSLTNVRGWPILSAHLGYWLGGDFQGNGLMPEAVAGACDWAFHALRLERMEAGTLPENTRSRRVLEKVGFVEEGYAKAYLEIAGKRRDHILYGLVRPTEGR